MMNAVDHWGHGIEERRDDALCDERDGVAKLAIKVLAAVHLTVASDGEKILPERTPFCDVNELRAAANPKHGSAE